MKINDTLNKIKEIASDNLPTLLASAGLADFEVYHVGLSRDANKKSFFVYQNEFKKSYSETTISIFIQLQLPGVSENEAAKYNDIVFDLIFSIPPQYLEMDMLSNCLVDSYSDMQQKSCYSFIMPEWIKEHDNCDLRS